MGRATIRVEVARYDEAAAGVRDGLQRALRRALTRAEADAKTTVPPRNRTGNLKGSIYSRVGSATGRDGVLGEVGATAEYAGYVEEGTRRNRAYPYLRPAAEKAVAGLEAELRDEIGDKL